MKAAPEPEPVAASPAAGASQPGAGLVGGLALEQELEDVTFRQTRGTTVEWELHAASVRQRPNQPAHLEQVTLRYYGRESEPTVVTADEAEYEAETQTALLRGNVHVVAPNGDTLDSDTLRWQGDVRQMSTDSEVTLRRGDSQITGQSLRTSPELEDVELFQVRGVFRNAELAG